MVKNQDEKIIIVGGGLSGLALAYFLNQSQAQVTVLESSTRLGGRIETVKGKLKTPLELGATWFSDNHSDLNSLLEELKISKFPQSTKGRSLFQTSPQEPIQEFFAPQGAEASYRITDGTQALIEALAESLTPDSIWLNTQIIKVIESGKGITLHSQKGETFHADKVILCLPPQSAISQIAFSPNLPHQLSSLLSEVQTWMAGSIKFALEYAEPFWRKENFSGMLFSHSGIISEMYDHCNAEKDKFGFTGFLTPQAARLTKDQRESAVIGQITELLGKGALSPSTYLDKVWSPGILSISNPSILRPHQNNGHSLLQESYFNGKLYFSGTECSIKNPGYMEGAISSAKRVFKQLNGS